MSAQCAHINSFRGYKKAHVPDARNVAYPCGSLLSNPTSHATIGAPLNVRDAKKSWSKS